MSFAKPIFTTRGKQIELQGIEGQQIIFTKIKIGDGRITTQSPSQLTDLINVIAEAPITSLKRYDAYAAIRSVFQNIDVPEAFWWREVGLFATDPATGEEVLYAYQNAYDTAEYITPSSLVTKKINWTIYIDDGENLGADIHKKMVFCSVEDLDEHNDLEGAHEPAFTAHNADTNSHTDIRNKIGTDISTHNTNTSAHTDIRNKIGTDISSHNTSTSAHTDIRNKIQALQQNVSTFMLPVKRNTTYAVGDCASATGLPSWAYLECVTAGTTDESEPDFSGVTSGDKITYGTTVFIIRKIGSLSGFNIGDIKWSSADLTQAGFLVANGAEVGRATYPDLCAVYEAMGFPWGAGDGSTTFNLPNLIGKFAEGADSAGGYKEAGLPNIEGTASLYTGNSNYNPTGAFVKNPRNNNNSTITGEYYFYYNDYSFDASRSNAIYGNSNTVQPNSALLIPYVKAFNGASADSTDLAITEVANDVARISEKISERVYLVESVVNDDGSWYRKYSDGWLEQAFNNKSITAYTNYSFLKPFKDTSYTLQYTSNDTHRLNKKTATSFSTADSGIYDIYACGMGAE